MHNLLFFVECLLNYLGSDLLCVASTHLSHVYQVFFSIFPRAALTASQFFPMAWSGDGFVISASLRLP